MTDTATSPEKQKNRPVLTSILSTTLVILFLFFIDEGNFDFSWATYPGGWFAFYAYFSGLLFCQCITYQLILRKYKGDYKNALTSVIGIPMGLILVISGFLYLGDL